MSRSSMSLILALFLLVPTIPEALAGSGAEAGAGSTSTERQIKIEKRYLNLPVKTGARKRWVTLKVEGRTVREFEIELADQTPDFWVFVDLEPFQGQEMDVKVDGQEPAPALGAIEVSDEIKGGDDLYREKSRPQFHFTSKRGWNNDPNGLVYENGEYHLFYQHNPYGWNWGNMHWGHAVSRDLVHWKELGDALFPDSLGTVFSGSAVVDDQNTAGFARSGHMPIVCIYTAAGGTSRESQGRRFSQCLAFSTDLGRSWTRFAGNPVLPNVVGENRDPKVIWYEPQQKWVLALYLEKSDYALFSSPDLKHWERMSSVTIPGTSECPEFFEIPVEGGHGETRWVFYGGNGRYLVGSFDGRTFRPETEPQPLNRGNCFYASQTYNHIPPGDGRRILIGWGQVNFPGMPFNQMMDFPVELKLRRTEIGLQLTAQPVREIGELRGKPVLFSADSVEGGQVIPGAPTDSMDVEVGFEPAGATEVELIVHGVSVKYEVSRGQLSCEKSSAPLSLDRGRVRLRLLVDRGSIEIFGNEGRVYMPMGSILNAQQPPIQFVSKGGASKAVRLTAYPLKSIFADSVEASGR